MIVKKEDGTYGSDYGLTIIKGEELSGVIYGDTDSVYCTLEPYLKRHNIEPTTENCVEIADAFGDVLNEHMCDFIADNFLIPKERASISEAGREVVFRKGLFKNVKKRYALHVIDDEGKNVSKLKIVGMDTRRSDTPIYIQKFLERAIEMLVMEDEDYDGLWKYVQEYRTETYRAMDPWQHGKPGRVSNLTTNSKKMLAYEQATADGLIGVKKPNLHYSVAAARNTNTLMTIMNETRWDYIRDGDKTLLLYLLPNEWGMKYVARKVDDPHVPDWFKELPFDKELHETKLVDDKLKNVFGVLGWNFKPPTNNADEIYEEEDFFS